VRPASPDAVLARDNRQPGLRLARGGTAPRAAVQGLQLDLRRLGYLRAGLDGAFGAETERAVRALQADLLANGGLGSDGEAPVPVTAFNRGRVSAINGVVDESLAAAVEELIGDGTVPKLPRAEDPARGNRDAVDAVLTMTHCPVPVPFLLAILQQETSLTHFRVPTLNDPDNFIVVGLDRNDPVNPDRITSRGYGIGQFTLFHHPPRVDEVQDLMLDPLRNVARAFGSLREKFEHFIVGDSPGAQADDRIVEAGREQLRACRYAPGDPRFQRDCRQCVISAPRQTLSQGMPVFIGAPLRLAPTPYHPEREYRDLPDRAALGCDWPYAVRRYNGSGINSYHYQAQVLERLANDVTLAELLAP
jgi:hypothetical protein